MGCVKSAVANAVANAIGSACCFPPISGGVSLAFSVAVMDSATGEMLLLDTGTGPATSTHTATIYAPDHEGVYQAFAANEPVWSGARISGGTAYGTDALGDPLASAPFLVYQPLVTNSQIKSNDLADAEWTATNMTVGDQDETGITGAPNTACSLTATANDATLIANAVTDAADNQAAKWWIKRDTGTGTVELTLDNGSTWQDVTADIDTTFGTGVVVDQAALANPQIGIRLGTSGDVVIIGNSQLHLGATTEQVLYVGPVFTTTAADSTDATVYTFPAANNDATSSAYYAEMVLPFDSAFANPTGQFARHIETGGSTTSGRIGFRSTSGFMHMYDGTNSLLSDAAPTIGSVEKIGAVWDAPESSSSIYQNGVKEDEDAFDGSMNPVGDIAIGGITDHAFLIRNLERYGGGTYVALQAKIVERSA